MKKPLTVAQLIALLQTLPQDLPTSAEGCDCIGDCAGAVVVEDGKDSYVLLQRSQVSFADYEDED